MGLIGCVKFEESQIKGFKQYAKLASIERYNISQGYSYDKDIHGLKWDERTILEVLAYHDGMCEVMNCNGLVWVTESNKLQTCDVNGNYIK